MRNYPSKSIQTERAVNSGIILLLVMKLKRESQLYHMQKIVHVMNIILVAFKTGEKDEAEFWINISHHLIHIRYFVEKVKN